MPCPPPPLRFPRLPRLALYAFALCALAAVAATVSFARGNWLGVVWIVLAGLCSNAGWYQLRRAGAAAGVLRPVGTCGTSSACGACVRNR